MKHQGKRWWMLVVVVSVIAALGQAPAQGAVFFEDNFDGAAIDAAKWNVSLATSGLRNCLQRVPSDPIEWRDVALSPCWGYTQQPPYGSITVSDGAASFQAGSSWTSPYITAGLPGTLPMFPDAGDFVFEMRAKYDSLAAFGTGIHLIAWDESSPVPSTLWPSAGAVGGIFGLHGDSNGISIYGAGTSVRKYDILYHVYRLEYTNGYYTFFIDGQIQGAPLASDVRPNGIAVGSPYLPWGGVRYDWTDFSIDYVRVTSPDVTPPVVTLSASPSILWPPNHKLVDVTIDGSAVDNGSGIGSVEITVSDEYGQYNMVVPGFGSTIQLEAGRAGADRDGRTYTITAVATDKAGNVSTATTTVIVPHDKGN
jgi:hypothetical protein